MQPSVAFVQMKFWAICKGVAALNNHVKIVFELNIFLGISISRAFFVLLLDCYAAGLEMNLLILKGTMLVIYGVQTSGLLAELAGADVDLVVARAALYWLQNNMFVAAVDFVLARKKAIWGEGLQRLLLVFWSQHISMQHRFDLISVSLHIDCRVQMLVLVLLTFGDGAVFSSINCLD